MQLDALQRQRRFLVRQKLTALINRYDVTTEAGEHVASVEQKRFAFREEVTFYADASRRVPLFRFKARSLLDLATTYDVTDGAGAQIGWFRKDFARSLLRSTWRIGGPHGEVTGHERSLAIALLRRSWDLLPFTEFVPFAVPYHFDFADPNGRRALAIERRWGIRDSYVVTIDDEELDRRLAIAQAVALDALQSR